MKSNFTKIAAIILALLVLLSTFSLTIEKHFCGDFLVSVSYFGNADGCGDELDNDDCDLPSVVKSKKCCTDQTQEIEGQDDLRTTSIEKITLKQQFALAFAITYNNLFANKKQQIVLHKNYPSPNLISNIQVLHQVFII